MERRTHVILGLATLDIPVVPNYPTTSLKRKVSSHVLSEMATPKWRVTGRWTSLCPRLWPHPLSGLLRRIHAQENSSV